MMSGIPLFQSSSDHRTKSNYRIADPPVHGEKSPYYQQHRQQQQQGSSSSDGRFRHFVSDENSQSNNVCPTCARDWSGFTEECPIEVHCLHNCKFLEKIDVECNHVRSDKGRLMETSSPGYKLHHNEQDSCMMNHAESVAQRTVRVSPAEDQWFGQKHSRSSDLTERQPDHVSRQRTSVNKWQPVESGSLIIRNASSVPFNTSRSLKEVKVKKSRPSIVGYDWNRHDEQRPTVDGEQSGDTDKDGKASWKSPWLEAASCGNVLQRAHGVRIDGKSDTDMKVPESKMFGSGLMDDHKVTMEEVILQTNVCGTALEEGCDGMCELAPKSNAQEKICSDNATRFKDGKLELDLATSKVGQRNSEPRTRPHFISMGHGESIQESSIVLPPDDGEENQTSGRRSISYQADSRDSRATLPVVNDRRSNVLEYRTRFESTTSGTASQTGNNKLMFRQNHSDKVEARQQTSAMDASSITDINGRSCKSPKPSDISAKSRGRGMNSGPRQRQQVQQEVWTKSTLPPSKISATQRGLTRRRRALDDQWWIRGQPPSTDENVCPRCASRDKNTSAAEQWLSAQKQTKGRPQADVTRGIYWKSSDRDSRLDVEQPHNFIRFDDASNTRLTSSLNMASPSVNSGVSDVYAVSVTSSAAQGPLAYDRKANNSEGSRHGDDLDQYGINRMTRAKSASQLNTAFSNLQLPPQPYEDSQCTLGSHLRSRDDSSVSPSSSPLQLTSSRTETGPGVFNVRTKLNELQGKVYTVKNSSKISSGSMSSNSSSIDIGFNHSVSSQSTSSTHDFHISPAVPIALFQSPQSPFSESVSSPMFLSTQSSNIPIVPPSPPCIQSSQWTTPSHPSSFIPPAPPIQSFLNGTWTAHNREFKSGSNSKTSKTSPKIFPFQPTSSSLMQHPKVMTSNADTNNIRVEPTMATPSEQSDNDDNEHYRKKLVKDLRQIIMDKNTKENHNSLPYRSKHNAVSRVLSPLSQANEWAWCNSIESVPQSLAKTANDTTPPSPLKSSHQQTTASKSLGTLLQEQGIVDFINTRVSSTQVDSAADISSKPYKDTSQNVTSISDIVQLRRPKCFFQELRQASMTSDGMTSSTVESTESSCGESRVSTTSLLSCPMSPTVEPQSRHLAESIIIHAGVGGVAYSMVRGNKI